MDMVPGPDRLGSAFPRHEPRGARRPLRRDERDDRSASQLRSGGDRPWRLWQGDRLRRTPGRALVEAISEPTRTAAGFRRWTGWSTGSASTSRPTAVDRASSTATIRCDNMIFDAGQPVVRAVLDWELVDARRSRRGFHLPSADVPNAGRTQLQRACRHGPGGARHPVGRGLRCRLLPPHRPRSSPGQRLSDRLLPVPARRRSSTASRGASRVATPRPPMPHRWSSDSNRSRNSLGPRRKRRSSKRAPRRLGTVDNTRRKRHPKRQLEKDWQRLPHCWARRVSRILIHAPDNELEE